MRYSASAVAFLLDPIRARIARRLERGEGAGLLSRAWAALAARSLARELTLPRGARVIGVGSAVLGGAGKTPLAAALARRFAELGHATALVGHAYRASPGRARRVLPNDPLAEVGDDALACAQLLKGSGASVIVAPSRQAALDHAEALGHRVIVVDGLLQTAPSRLAASLLVVDAAAPWGAGACPPAGDLRAPPDALRAAADLVVAITPEEAGARLPAGAILVPSRVTAASRASGERVALSALVGRKVGLFVAIAHPERVLAALARVGITPDPVISLADHAQPSVREFARAARARVDAWLTSTRCAVKLPPTLGDAPVLALEHCLDLAELMAPLTNQMNQMERITPLARQ